jgi:hypothetical protein
MMFLEGYMGEPPTVTVCSLICICARVGAAAPASASEATVTNIAVRESFMSFSIWCLQFAPRQRLAMEIRMMRATAGDFRILGFFSEVRMN